MRARCYAVSRRCEVLDPCSLGGVRTAYSNPIHSVSQFTLLASTKKGNKPSFHDSAGPDQGRELYGAFFNQIQRTYRKDKVKDGVFQAMMDVALVNDGPVSEETPETLETPRVGVDFCSLEEEVQRA